MTGPTDELVAPVAPSESLDSETAQIVELALQKSRQIATLPQVVVKIIQHCEDPGARMEELNKIIVHDPVLVMRVLKLMNSAYYGMSGQIKSIKQAMMMLGLTAVKNIAIAASLVKLFRKGLICTGFEATDLWEHSLAVATATRMLAKQSKMIPTDEAFLAGLIHDMGIVIEMQAFGPKFAETIKTVCADRTLTFRAAEIETLGASHEVFGAGLCRAWSLPISLQLATSHHHRPWDLPEIVRVLPAMVHIADLLAAQNRLGYSRTVETETIDPQLLVELNLDEAMIATISQELPDAVRESRQMMSES